MLHADGLNTTVKKYRLLDCIKPNTGLEVSVF